MTKASLRDGGEDPFELYASWRAEEEMDLSRRQRLAWGMGAVLLALSAYGMIQALVAG